jgi:hypothetical protein
VKKLFEWFRRKAENTSEKKVNLNVNVKPPNDEPKPIHREVYPVIFRNVFNERASHVLLKSGFCCEKHQHKLLATNHTAQLFGCYGGRQYGRECLGKLIKMPIDGA